METLVYGIVSDEEAITMDMAISMTGLTEAELRSLKDLEIVEFPLPSGEPVELPF